MTQMTKSILGGAFIAASLTCASTATGKAPIQTSYFHDFAANIDDGGDVSSEYFYISGGIPIYRDDDIFVSLSASYQLHSYSFSDGPVGSFAGRQPWNDISTAKISSYMTWNFAERWEFFGNPSIRSSGENGANFADTLTVGALFGLSYKFSDNLTIGPGAGVIGELEDTPNIFPILIIDWQITDTVSLTTGPTIGASQGPGLAIKWQIDDDLRFTFGARSESRRFRLDSSASGTQNVGEDNSIPVFGILTWQATQNIQASVIAGVGISNDFILDDSQGNRITRQDYDSSPFLGVNLGYSF
jgi:hypothetical protein